MAKNILIVDDAAFMRMVMKDALLKGGYTSITEAADGKQALEKFKQARPDLVIMDITMPEMDGLTALKEMQRLDPTVPVIMCSAMGQQEMVIDAIKGGAKDFIVKPFPAERVREAVKKHLG